MRKFNPGALGAAFIAVVLALVSQVAVASSVAQQNLADLIRHSDEIVVGTVKSVTDGFTDEGVPFTEVTLAVSDKIRGAKADVFTFRQFGLIEPREIDGRVYLGTTLDGWPTWNKDESVMLFMGKSARLTGLRTTVGLGQGKLRLVNGQYMNEANNNGLFDKLNITAQGLSPEQRDMLASNGAALRSGAFTDLVRRAVNENWIGTGVMTNEK